MTRRIASNYSNRLRRAINQLAGDVSSSSGLEIDYLAYNMTANVSETVSDPTKAGQFLMRNYDTGGDSWVYTCNFITPALWGGTLLSSVNFYSTAWYFYAISMYLDSTWRWFMMNSKTI